MCRSTKQIKIARLHTRKRSESNRIDENQQIKVSKFRISIFS